MFGIADVLEYGRFLVGGCADELGNQKRKNFFVLYGDLIVVFFVFFMQDCCFTVLELNFKDSNAFMHYIIRP